MRCPLCDVNMKEVERRGVLIDVCPECKGVWLDRGELDKLLAASYRDYGEEEREESARRREHEAPEWLPPHKKKHKRRSFLEDLFDFD